MFDITTLLRPNIAGLKAYSSARDEYTGSEDAIFIDANENPYPTAYNRYPDPYCRAIKAKLAPLKGVDVQQIFAGNGSDEAIDLLVRAFCEPGKDNVLAIDPSYGMYQVCAEINNVELKKVLLTSDFNIDLAKTKAACDANTKIIFLCSPNNPTGNLLHQQDVLDLLAWFKGIVVVDEAYIDFSSNPGYTPYLSNYGNLVVLQTFSKAWGMAGARFGLALANTPIIEVLNKIKYPYNVNILTQKAVLEALNRVDKTQNMIAEIVEQREILRKEVAHIKYVEEVLASEANFFLLKVPCPKDLYAYLIRKNIVVRDRSSVSLCEGCLRITVGTPEENSVLLQELNNYIDK